MIYKEEYETIIDDYSQSIFYFPLAKDGKIYRQIIGTDIWFVFACDDLPIVCTRYKFIDIFEKVKSVEVEVCYE